MQWIRRKSWLAVAALATAACGSDGATAPNLDQELDPAVVEERLAQSEAIYDHPAFVSMMSLQGGAVNSVSAPVDRTRRLLTDVRQSVSGGRRVKQSRSVSLTLGSFVPVDVHGDTYMWDAVNQQWSLADRTGAPANGVRFILPELVDGVPTGEDIGHLDVKDLGTASQDGVNIVLVSNGKTLLNMTETESETETAYSWKLVGFISDGEHRIDFSGVDSGTETATDYRYTSKSEWKTNFGLAGKGFWVDGGATANDADYDQVTVGRATIRWSTPYVYDAVEDYYYTSDTTNVTVNGRAYAANYYDDASGTWVYEKTDGTLLTAEETARLDNAWELAYGFGEYLWYPYFIAGQWVSSISAPLVY